MSVTVFLQCQSKFLLVHRSPHKKVDANRLNGIGGKVEPGENFLETAVRETREETGYQLSPADFRFVGLTQLQGGYEDDWVAAFFTAQVTTPVVPIGMDTPEGQLLWLSADEVVHSPYECVDDLHYIWPAISQGQIFFLAATLDSQEKIQQSSLTTLS